MMVPAAVPPMVEFARPNWVVLKALKASAHCALSL